MPILSDRGLSRSPAKALESLVLAPLHNHPGFGAGLLPSTNKLYQTYPRSVAQASATFYAVKISPSPGRIPRALVESAPYAFVNEYI